MASGELCFKGRAERVQAGRAERGAPRDADELVHEIAPRQRLGESGAALAKKARDAARGEEPQRRVEIDGAVCSGRNARDLGRYRSQ